MTARKAQTWATGVSTRPPSPPRPSPYSGGRGLPFSPDSRYMCTRLIKYSTSPLPVGPAVLREKGLYDSDRDSLRVAWKRVGVGWLSLGLLFILIPLLVLITHRWREPGLLPGLTEAPVVALPSLRDVTKVLVDLTWGHRAGRGRLWTLRV